MIGVALPPETHVLWCHHCETYQRASQLRVARPPWDPERLMLLCTRVDCDEPLGLGVWDMTDRPGVASAPCAHVEAMADARDSAYGCPVCHAAEVAS